MIEYVKPKPRREFLDALKEELLYLENDKEEVQRFLPRHTMYIDLLAHIRDSLNELYRRKEIEVGRSVNDQFIKLRM